MSEQKPPYDGTTNLTEAEQLAWLQRNRSTVWFGHPETEGQKVQVADIPETIAGKTLQEAIHQIEQRRRKATAFTQAMKERNPNASDA